MRRFLSYIIVVVIITVIYLLVNTVFGTECDSCHDTIFGTRYHDSRTDKNYCERCARH